MVHCVACCRYVNKCCTGKHASLVVIFDVLTQDWLQHNFTGLKPNFSLIRYWSNDGAILFRMRRSYSSYM